MKSMLSQSAATYEAFAKIIELEGSGSAGSQVIVTSTAPLSYLGDDDDSDGSGLFAYKLQCLTAGCTFAALSEDGEDVDADRLDGGDSGYPIGTILNGKFDNVEMAAGSIALAWVINL